MACGLTGPKPLSEPMLEYCYMGSLKQISKIFWSKYNNFIQENASENIFCKVSSIRHQVITWTIVDKDPWCHTASPGNNEFIVPLSDSINLVHIHDWTLHHSTVNINEIYPIWLDLNHNSDVSGYSSHWTYLIFIEIYVSSYSIYYAYPHFIETFVHGMFVCKQNPVVQMASFLSLVVQWSRDCMYSEFFIFSLSFKKRPESCNHVQ